MEEQLKLKTGDGVNLSALFVSSTNQTNTVVLLLHQLRRDKTIWRNLMKKLSENGKSSLAFDFRGHGQSGGGNWQDFSEEDFTNFMKDVETGANAIREKFPSAEMALIGSSIGANLALNYGAKNNVSSVVLLSPGIDYRGIKIEEAASGFTKPLFMVASTDDSNESVDAVNRIQEIIQTPQDQLKVITYDQGGHGVNLFIVHTELVDQIVQWVI